MQPNLDIVPRSFFSRLATRLLARSVIPDAMQREAQPNGASQIRDLAPQPSHIKSRPPFLSYADIGQPIWAPRDYAAFAREGFMQNAVVYRCVRLIAENTAAIPLLLYAGDTEIESHPLKNLLRAPHPTATYPDFMESFLGFLLVSGNAYIEAVSFGGEIRELHLLRPDRVKIVPGADGWPEAYDYTVDGRTTRIEGEAAPGIRRVLHMRLFHPVNDHYGLSPIEAAACAIDLHNAAAKWNKALLDNSARPSGALVYTSRDGNLTPDQFDRLKSELETNFQGSGNAGRPLLLEGGLDWKAMSMTPKDLDFIEAKNAAAREIALALGVPPLLLGIPGDNTYGHDPYDPGGPTNLGITLATLAAWRSQPLTEQSHPALLAALQSLSETEAGAIYHARYWIPSLAARLPQPLAFMHFDAAVNHGVTGAARLLQTALGVDVDGEIGPVTLRAANSGDVRAHLAAYAEARRTRYRALPHFWRFGRGWLARVDTTLAAALRIPMPTPDQQPKRKDKSMSQPISDSEPKWWGHSLTIWGAIITTLSTVLPAIGPLIGLDVTAELVRQLGAAIAQAVEAIGGVVGIVLTIFGRIRAVQPLTRRPVSLKV